MRLSLLHPGYLHHSQPPSYLHYSHGGQLKKKIPRAYHRVHARTRYSPGPTGGQGQQPCETDVAGGPVQGQVLLCSDRWSPASTPSVWSRIGPLGNLTILSQAIIRVSSLRLRVFQAMGICGENRADFSPFFLSVS